MRSLLLGFAVLGLSLAMLSGATAQDKKKETTLTGSITCAKCDLGTETECKTVIVVKGKGKAKDTTYYFDAKGHETHHDAICTAAKKGSVTGVVSVDGKKSIVTVKSVKFE